MVKVKEFDAWIAPDGSVDLELWLQQLSDKGYSNDLGLIRGACTLSQLTGAEQPAETDISCFKMGLSVLKNCFI